MCKGPGLVRIGEVEDCVLSPQGDIFRAVRVLCGHCRYRGGVSVEIPAER